MSRLTVFLLLLGIVAVMGKFCLKDTVVYGKYTCNLGYNCRLLKISSTLPIFRLFISPSNLSLFGLRQTSGSTSLSINCASTKKHHQTNDDSNHGSSDSSNSYHGSSDSSNSYHGSSDPSNSYHGSSDPSNSYHGSSDPSNSNHGNSNHGNSNHGNSNHGNTKHDNSDNDNSSNDDSSNDNSSSGSSGTDFSDNDNLFSNNNHKCHRYESWSKCGRQCEPTCGNQTPNHMYCKGLKCNSQTAGCRCQSGFVRNNRGQCVVAVDCPKSQTSSQSSEGW
ncbi:uncharacterized protein LOC143145460 [Ptiloglossa arizonensis]|uniref:uncharacterized protein LOC143145460 n=1 Tax=Ptiloglossa arizonensis TaxID=3350558 RepID=UPI003FA1241B